MNWQSYLTSQFQLILWTIRTKYYSQASHLVRQPQSFHLYTNTRIGHQRSNSKTFAKRLNFLWFLYLLFFLLCFFSSALLTSPSLFSYPYSYPLQLPSFSCATIHFSPSQLLFLLLLITFSHVHHPLLSSPSLSPHYPSLLHIHHLLTNLLYQLYTSQPLVIPDTSILH
jgi:hypothetical protein